MLIVDQMLAHVLLYASHHFLLVVFVHSVIVAVVMWEVHWYLHLLKVAIKLLKAAADWNARGPVVVHLLASGVVLCTVRNASLARVIVRRHLVLARYIELVL